MSKIMVIEDDRALAAQVKEVLENYSYKVVMIKDFQKVEEQVQKERPQLIILDINLPYFDGNYYCKRIRRASKVPIIITSARNSEMDQILSMELGADDYIIKPFSMTVLLAKVNATMRRLYGEYAKLPNTDYISQKGLQLNVHSFQLQYKEKIIELTKNEYRLMKEFLQNPDQVISREVLLEALWDSDLFVDDNTLTVNVTRLKQKLAALGIKGVIKTKRGVGYLFDLHEMED
ncbi:MAG: response regulator transcription factor [bacterium]|nr:response regulator transcription factor [bacterium]